MTFAIAWWRLASDSWLGRTCSSLLLEVLARADRRSIGHYACSWINLLLLLLQVEEARALVCACRWLLVETTYDQTVLRVRQDSKSHTSWC